MKIYLKTKLNLYKDKKYLILMIKKDIQKLKIRVISDKEK